MTTGLSGTYAIGGVDFPLPPTTGKWNERTSYGVDGNGHPIYSSIRSFELKWELISMSDLATLTGFYNAVGNTGTAVACLPKWGDPTFTFYNYSGTTLQEPSISEYYQGYVQNVTMLITNVRTN